MRGEWSAFAHNSILAGWSAFFTKEKLEDKYKEALDYLDHAQIQWVSVGYLRKLAREKKIMPLCQKVKDEHPDHCRHGSDGLRGTFVDHRIGSPPDRTRGRFIVSHPWLSKEHPDPMGNKLHALVAELDRLNASDDNYIFFDFLGLPQHDQMNVDLRKMEQEKIEWWKKGLAGTCGIRKKEE